MFSTHLPANYVPLVVTSGDIKLASIAWGFTLGVGALTAWKALKQTQRISKTKRLRSLYIWMMWGEIAACLAFSIICWLHLNGNIPPSFGFYFGVLTCWSLQVQLLLQIIINRIAIIDNNKKQIRLLKYSVAGIVALINISVYCIWIPARLQISPEFIHINNIWDRCEKTIYLLIDAALNWKFIWIVRKNLVNMGLEKYRSLMHVNIAIVLLSLSMDVLIIGMMSLRNTFVYCQFHPLAYLVKLHIELHLADLIAEISRRPERIVGGYPTTSSKNANNWKHIDVILDEYSRTTTTKKATSQGITKTQDIIVETTSIGKDSTTSDKENAYGNSGSGTTTAVVGGGWTHGTGDTGDEEPLREGEMWDGAPKKATSSKFSDSDEYFPS